jgi:tight adherence protein B
MKRRGLLAVAASLSALVFAVASGAADGELELIPASGVAFPERAFILSLPEERDLVAGSVQVRENGELVRAPSVIPAGEEAGQSGVVLVIDASSSMRGDAIVGALAAGEAFAAQRNAFQQVAVITFNNRSTTVLPFTTDQEAIEQALATPPRLANGTHAYDAVGAAVELLQEAKIPAGSVILLSDGADTGSTATVETVAAAAREARVRIFSVGLHGKRFRPEALQDLAERAGGDYSDAASVDDLAPIFDQLGHRLASEYIIRYRSEADAGEEIHVAVRVAGYPGVAQTVYTTPSGGAAEAPFHRSALEVFLRSPGAMVVASLMSAALVATALILLLRPRTRSLQTRMAEFVSLAPGEDKKGQRRSEVLTRAEKSFEQASWWPGFKEKLEIARIKMPAIQIIVSTGIATAVGMLILYAIGGSILFAPLALAIPLVVNSAINRALERQRNLFADQLPDNLQVLASALRAGHSLVGALSVVVDDCSEPSRTEFQRVVADEQLGVPLEDALAVVARRMDSIDVGQVGLVSALQRETGGNTAEVLDRVAENVRGRFELRRLVKTLTAQGRMSRWIVSFLPVGLLILITLINPEYMEPLYTNTFGRVLLALAAVMVVAGSLVIRRIVNIKV